MSDDEGYNFFCVECGRRYRTIREIMAADACPHGNAQRIGKPRDETVTDIASILKGKERSQ